MPAFAEILSPEILIIVAVVVVLLFGGSKLPELARSLGSAKGEFEEASKDSKASSAGDSPSSDA